MVSKLVTDRERSSSFVVSFLHTHAARLEEGVRGSLPEPHRSAAVAPVALALAASLAAAVRGLVSADQRNESELADDAVPRERRDRAWTALRESMLAFRTVIGANYGDVALQQLGLWDTCPPDYAGTLAYARDLVRALDGPPTLSAPRHAASAVDLSRARLEIDALRAALETGLASVTANEARNAASLAEKSRAMTEHDRVRRAVLDTACGLFDTAGMSELGETLRAAVRRDTPSVEPIVEPAPAAPTNGASAPTGAPAQS